MISQIASFVSSIAPPAVIAVIIGFFLNKFDGIRKAKLENKSLSCVFWYGALPMPRNVPEWVGVLVKSIKKYFLKKSTPQPIYSSSERAIVFVINNGRIVLKSDDLFKKTPLSLLLSEGEIVSAKIIFESEQVSDAKLWGAPSFFRKPKHHLSERKVGFGYIAPNHGFVIEIEYRRSGTSMFSLSGPVSGMKQAVKQQVLYEVDIEDIPAYKRRAKSDLWRVRLGGFVMLVCVFGMLTSPWQYSWHPVSANTLTYQILLLVFSVAEFIALLAWFRIAQMKKIPTALRYWEFPLKG